MAKRSTEWLTVRQIVSVMPVFNAGKWVRTSIDIVVREQGGRMKRVRMTRKTGRMLIGLLEAALS
jgi:hypothetical protein